MTVKNINKFLSKEEPNLFAIERDYCISFLTENGDLAPPDIFFEDMSEITKSDILEAISIYCDLNDKITYITNYKWM